MPSVLKGNFATKKDVTVDDQNETLEGRFEKEALKNLGGSICFVRKKKVHWGDEGDDTDQD